MVKKRERQSTEKLIENFANLAESSIENNCRPQKEKKYKRITLSLTDIEDKLMDEISLKPRSFRCSRSQVVKAALTLLNQQDESVIIKLLEDQK